MTEIAKGIVGGSWTLLLGWILPSALGLSVSWLTILPSVSEHPPFDQIDQIATASASSQALMLLVASIIVGLSLSSIATPLYRILEGYLLWPAKLAAKRTDKHIAARREAEALVTQARDKDNRLDLRGSLALEKFRRYPDQESQIAPTRLGNAIRRFEYYSFDRYQLSSQAMWDQLRGAVPESVAKNVDQARAGVDFFVCLLYISGVVAVSALAALFSDQRQVAVLIVTAVLALAVAVACYPLAVAATDAWASAVRAMVDLGRVPLAKNLGLTLPATLAEERQMWLSVGWFLAFKFDASAAAAWDGHRAVPEDLADLTGPVNAGRRSGVVTVHLQGAKPRTAGRRLGATARRSKASTAPGATVRRSSSSGTGHPK